MCLVVGIPDVLRRFHSVVLQPFIQLGFGVQHPFQPYLLGKLVIDNAKSRGNLIIGRFLIKQVWKVRTVLIVYLFDGSRPFL